jgi:ribosomal protein S18 acetylase RimI-like enzyme
MSNQYVIGQIRENEWCQVAELITQAIPNALVSKLGNSFGAIFYRKIVEQPCSCGYAARNESDSILGVIIGTMDHHKVRSTTFKGHWQQLLTAANFRLLGWSVIKWVIKGLLAKFSREKQDHTDRPVAELIAITLHPEARGTGLARKLMEEMEKFMLSKKLSGPYTILTEKANVPANRFYEKIGATFIRTNLYHGRQINQWHKKIHGTKQDE